MDGAESTMHLVNIDSLQELSRQVADMITKCEKSLRFLRQRTQDTDLSSLKLQLLTP